MYIVSISHKQENRRLHKSLIKVDKIRCSANKAFSLLTFVYKRLLPALVIPGPSALPRRPDSRTAVAAKGSQGAQGRGKQGKVQEDKQGK